MTAETLLANQLHIIGETKYKEFQIINNFWKQQHSFIKEWENCFNKMNELFTKEAHIIESTFYSNSCGFIPKDGETIITSISYIGNITQLLCRKATSIFQEVLTSFDTKFKAIEKEFKSAGFTTKSHQKDVVNETIVTSLHSLTQTASITITKMFTDFITQYEDFFRLGLSFIDDSEQFKRMKENIEKRITDDKYKLHTNIVQYSNVPLAKILEVEKRTKRDLPRVIENIHFLLLKKGLNTKGIFRETNTSQNTIQEIYLRMSVTNFEELTPDAIAAVYKRFLRGLPGNIFNEEQSLQLANKFCSLQGDTSQIVDILKDSIEQLPEELKTLFIHLLRLCSKIAQNEKTNSMPPKNLAVCLTPSVFDLSENESSQFALPSLLNVMVAFINNFSTLFPRYADPFDLTQNHLVSTSSLNTVSSNQPNQMTPIKTSNIPNRKVQVLPTTSTTSSQTHNQPISRHTSSFVPKKKIGVKQTVQQTSNINDPMDLITKQKQNETINTTKKIVKQTSTNYNQPYHRPMTVASQNNSQQNQTQIKTVKKSTMTPPQKPLPSVRSTVSVASQQRSNNNNNYMNNYNTNQEELFSVLAKRRKAHDDK